MEKGKQQKDDMIQTHSSEKKKLSKEEQNVGEGIDVISSLPENVLHHILSFLSTKDAIRTSILSRKWVYLWTSISNIELDEQDPRAGRKEDRSLFLDFVNRVLLLHDASDIKSLNLSFSGPVDSSRLKSWISTAIGHNLEELSLSSTVETQFVLPCCLFTCKSLFVLIIDMDCVLKAPSLIQFSNLKTLKLWNVAFANDKSTQQLFSSCPVLQELVLMNCGWQNIKAITISIPTLKRLTIENDDQDMLSCVTKISAPNLIHLDCTSNLTVDFHLCDLSSLVYAFMEVLCQELSEHDVASRALGLVTGMYNVKELTIPGGTLQSIRFVENLQDRLPTFYRLTHLVLITEYEGHISGVMMDLLEKSPKLEFLDFAEGFEESGEDDDEFDEDDDEFGEVDFVWDRVPSCFESSLKSVRIAHFKEKLAEMQFIRFLLKNATVLERLTMYWLSPVMKKQQQEVISRLNKLPRASESCVIEFL